MQKYLKKKNNTTEIGLGYLYYSFFEFQKERSIKNEIAYSSISNYYKSVKLFAEMNFGNLL
jgi:hypothetical protein